MPLTIVAFRSSRRWIEHKKEIATFNEILIYLQISSVKLSPRKKRKKERPIVRYLFIEGRFPFAGLASSLSLSP